MSDYDMMEPFEIDHGELEGLEPAVVFCLGYELCQIHSLADKGRAFEKTVHVANVTRIGSSLMRRGLSFNVAETGVEGWAYLKVEDQSP